MRRILKALTAIMVLMASAPVLARADTGWAYDGPYGPQVWADLDVDFATCRDGEQQSPINLTGAVETRLKPIELNWRATDWVLENTGRTISAQPKDGGYAIIDGERFEFVDFVLRSPSEHSIDGIFYPMEAQFVHQSETGQEAVVSVMFENGGTSDRFDRFMANAPVEERRNSSLEGFDASGFITDLGDLFQYQGSLTTPPCTQNVIWSVLTDPFEISDAALLAFSALFGENARPVQPLNRRYILTD